MKIVLYEIQVLFLEENQSTQIISNVRTNFGYAIGEGFTVKTTSAGTFCGDA